MLFLNFTSTKRTTNTTVRRTGVSFGMFSRWTTNE